jgi:phage gpG-like protein
MPDIKTVIQRYNTFLRILPDIVADEIMGFVLDNYEKAAFDGQAWAPRKDGDTSRALLVKTGRGRRSIRVLRKTRNVVSVGTDLDYMIAHNDGAEITRVITPRMRRFFWAMHYLYEANPDGSLKVSEEDVKWKWLALKKGPITFKMPQRQFIGPSPVLDARIAEGITEELKKVFT